MADMKRLDEVDLRNVSTTAYRLLRELGYDWQPTLVEARIQELMTFGDGQGEETVRSDGDFAIVFTRPGFCRVYVQAGTMRYD